MDEAEGYREWAVGEPLRRYVWCTWTAPPSPAGPTEPVLPDGCIDIIWDGARLFVSGPDTGPVLPETEGRQCVGIRFRPGMAPLFLGPPADDLLDRRVDLGAMWPRTATLTELLSETRSARQAAAVLEAQLVSNGPGSPVTRNTHFPGPPSSTAPS